MKKDNPRKTRFGYGLGTVGRDMVAAMTTMYLMFYMTDVVKISKEMLASVTAIIVFMRIFDGLNDPFMGSIVDNTKSRWGKFKPWMLSGAILWAIAHIFMFYDTGLQGAGFLVFFFFIYLFWEVAYTMNDIAYWSMIPALSRDQKEKEKIGSIARICASVGMFAFVVALVPVSSALTKATGDARKSWFIIAAATAVLMVFFQTFTLLFVKEQTFPQKKGEKTTFRDIFRIIGRNDQLLTVTFAMLFFMTAYTTTTGLGIYYFKYLFGDENMYAVFAGILGVSQIIGLMIFPLISAKMKRRHVFALGSALVVAGLGAFFFSPKNMVLIGASGILLFVGEAFIQVLMLMFITDSVEYGQWKFKKRNDSVTSSLQPLIYKASNAFASLIIAVTLAQSGIHGAASAAGVTPGGALTFRVFMFVIPAACIIVSYAVMRRYYKIDETFYAKITEDNRKMEIEILSEQNGTPS